MSYKADAQKNAVAAASGKASEELQRLAKEFAEWMGGPEVPGGAIGQEGAAKTVTPVKGDVAGHDFHGNQWTSGQGEGAGEQQPRPPPPWPMLPPLPRRPPPPRPRTSR